MWYRNICSASFSFVTIHACDRRTDRRTDRQNYDSQDRPRICSRGKNACPKSGVSFPRTNRGPQNHLFWPTSQLNGNFNGLYLRNENVCIRSVFRRLRDLMANIFWMKRDTDNRKRALESKRGFVHRLKISWTLVHKRLKIGSEFATTLRKFCIVLPTRCTRKPNPTKRCQTGGNKWRWCEPNKVTPHSECKCNHRN